MTAQQIVNDLILDNQNLVIEELMKHDDSIWDSLQNFNENSTRLKTPKNWMKSMNGG